MKELNFDSLRVISGIYCITNKLTGTKYVGQSSNILARLGSHISNHSSNSFLQLDIRNCGLKNFSFEILEEVIEEENLKVRERFYLASYRDLGITLYNDHRFIIEKGKIVGSY